jgi:hypothetical protein
MHPAVRAAARGSLAGIGAVHGQRASSTGTRGAATVQLVTQLPAAARAATTRPSAQVLRATGRVRCPAPDTSAGPLPAVRRPPRLRYGPPPAQAGMTRILAERCSYRKNPKIAAAQRTRTRACDPIS